MITMDKTMRVQSSKSIRSSSSVLVAYHACFLVLNVFFAVWVISSVLQSDLTLDYHSNMDKLPNRVLFYKLWWPTDVLELPTYFFVFVWQNLIQANYIHSLSATNIFICALTIAASERASMLARTAPQALLPGPRGVVTPQFKEWVQYHQHYLSIVNGINSTMGSLIFVSLFFACMNIIAQVFFSIQYREPTVRLLSSIYCVGIAFELFMFSRAGQTLINNSILLRESVVNASQVSRGGLKAGPARSALQVLVTRLSGGAKSEEISGLGYFTVSMEFFSTVLSASVSYILVLIKLEYSQLPQKGTSG